MEARAARIELARRALARDPVTFAASIDVPGRPVGEDDSEEFAPVESRLAEHHKLILRAMEETASTPHGRLMIFAPPGSAKSSYASVVFPCHYLGAQAGRKIILASYGDELARKMGRKTRSVVRQRLYRATFRCGLSAESSAAQEFALTNGSEYMACGILSGVTGNRAHGVVLDDPVKGRQEANSPAVSQKTWEAYNDDLKTRLIPGGWITLIQTRWSENDIAGRILPDDWKGESGIVDCKDGMRWRVLCLQAKCETDSDPLGRKQGDYLWPEWFDREHWAQFESLPLTWSSLYQQVPSPAGGAIFRPDVMPVIDAVPAGSTWVRGWDFAASDKAESDYTVGAKLGRLTDGRYVIADIARGQWVTDERDAAFRGTTNRDGPVVKVSIPQDPGQAGKSQITYLTRQVPGFRVTSSPESGDKVTRAEPLAAQINTGNVLMVRGPWNDQLVNEMRMFPNGRHDDQIDACSRAFSDLVTRSAMRINPSVLRRS